MSPVIPRWRAVRDGLSIVGCGLVAGFLVTGIASVGYRPRGHVGSPLDWLRVGGYLLAMAVGAPLRLHTPTGHGQLRLVPLTVTAVLVVTSVRLGRRRVDTVVCGLTAAAAVALVSVLATSHLHSYGRHLDVRYSVSPLLACIGSFVVVGLSYGLAGRLPPAWSRTLAGALHGLVVVGCVAAVTAIGVALWRFPASTLAFGPGLLGDGAGWLGGFSLGGRLTADLSSPIPFLSGSLGSGLITGGARPAAYALLVVPLAAAVVAGRRQQLGAAADVREWAEFGRAVVVNAALWLVVVEASRLRFSGRLGADALSGSAGLDLATTVFVAALWGGASAVLGLTLRPPTQRAAAADS